MFSFPLEKKKSVPSHKILVVCLGNICRSPSAEAILRQKAIQRGMNILVDSAGTIDFHQGAKPDPRSRLAAEKRGYDFSGIYARKVKAEDFETFDFILAADEQNLEDLKQICPSAQQSKLHLFLSFSSEGVREIPDPYFGGDAGFDEVVRLIEQGADDFLNELQSSS